MTAVTLHSLAETTALVRDTAVPVVDYGVAHRGVGHAPPPGERVEVAVAGGVIEHHAEDFAVRVAAGTAMGPLQRTLAEAGQFLPIDADEDVTVGEVIVHHVWGPLRVGFGSVRELLLGLAYVDGGGSVVRVGGRTVKNVAGLDVTRLMVGSLGELGLIVEATLRTYALPAAALAVDVALADPAALDARMTALLCSDAAPARLELEHRGGWVARLAYLGDNPACAGQVQALEQFIGTVAGAEVAGTAELPVLDYLAQRQAAGAWRRQRNTVAKLTVPPASTAATAAALRQRWPALEATAAPAHGQVFVGGDLDTHDAERLDVAIREAMGGVGGIVVWHARPAGAAIEPFWPGPGDMGLLRRLKPAMDPRGVLNPGRMILMP